MSRECSKNKGLKMNLVSKVFFTASTDITYNDYVRGRFDVISSPRKADFWTNVDGIIVNQTDYLIQEIKAF